MSLARQLGWKVFHVYDSRMSAGAGFPDLVLVSVRLRQVLFVELKTDQGKVISEQWEWLYALAASRQKVAVWRPGDRDEVIKVLSGELSL